MQIFPSVFLICFILRYVIDILTQLPTQFFPYSLQPHFISRIITLFSCILHIFTLIPHIPIPHFALFPAPILLISLPDSPILAFADSHFLPLTQIKLLISENLNY